ncbi:MAG: hypothetical protein RL199_126 [Pseudomonadota bacterium]|jgi:uncharacterized RDD family membrane protein YckC
MKCARCMMKLTPRSLVCGRCGEPVPRVVPIAVGSRPGVSREAPRTPVRVVERAAPPAGQAPQAARVRHAPTVWSRPVDPRRVVQGHVPLPSTIGPAVIGAKGVRSLQALPSLVHGAKTDPAFHHPHEADDAHDLSIDDLPGAPAPLPLVWARFGAGAIDLAAVSLLTLVALGAGVVSFGPARLGPYFDRGLDYVLDGLLVGQRLGLFVFALAALIGVVYTALGHFLLGTTAGKALMGLEVVDRRGRAPSPGEALVRSVAWGIGMVPAGAGYAFALFDREHQPLHDRLVGTRVVRKAA